MRTYACRKCGTSLKAEELTQSDKAEPDSYPKHKIDFDRLALYTSSPKEDNFAIFLRTFLNFKGICKK